MKGFQVKGKNPYRHAECFRVELTKEAKGHLVSGWCVAKLFEGLGLDKIDSHHGIRDMMRPNVKDEAARRHNWQPVQNCAEHFL